MSAPEPPPAGPPPEPFEVGPVEVGPVAHGGHCVARHEGRVIFVRHALPGERVRIRITDTSHDRFWRGDAVADPASPSPDRVPPACPVAGRAAVAAATSSTWIWRRSDGSRRRWWPSSCSGWPGSTGPVRCEPVCHRRRPRDGLDWRTRMRYPGRRGGPGRAAGAPLARRRTAARGGCPIADACGRRGGGAGPGRRGPSCRSRRTPPARWRSSWPTWSRRGPEVAAANGSPDTSSPSPPTASGRFIRRPPTPWSEPSWTGLRAESRGAGVRPLLRGRAVRRRAGRAGCAGLGGRIRPGRGAARSPQRARPPGSAAAGWSGSCVGCRSGPTWSCWIRRAAAPAGRCMRAAGRPTPAGDRLRRLRPGGAGPRSRLAAAGWLPTRRSIRAFDLFPMTHHVECVAILVPDGTA